MGKAKILVIGCSKLGASIANEKSLAGHSVSVIDKNAESFVKLNEAYTGYTFEGDATEIQVLEKAKAFGCDEVDIMTDNDETNILIASIIENYYPSVSSIFVRLRDEDKAILLDNEKIKVICPTLVAMKEYESFRGNK